jgi:hypothetical protein
VDYTITSPPVIVGDVLVVGSAIGDNRAVHSELGIVRGIDARTGKERWRRFEAALLAQRSGSRFAITIELVFGQAWGRVGGAPSRSAPREASIPVERLRGSRKSVSRE